MERGAVVMLHDTMCEQDGRMRSDWKVRLLLFLFGLLSGVLGLAKDSLANDRVQQTVESLYENISPWHYEELLQRRHPHIVGLPAWVRTRFKLTNPPNAAYAELLEQYLKDLPDIMGDSKLVWKKKKNWEWSNNRYSLELMAGGQAKSFGMAESIAKATGTNPYDWILIDMKTNASSDLRSLRYHVAYNVRENKTVLHYFKAENKHILGYSDFLESSAAKWELLATVKKALDNQERLKKLSKYSRPVLDVSLRQSSAPGFDKTPPRPASLCSTSRPLLTYDPTDPLPTYSLETRQPGVRVGPSKGGPSVPCELIIDGKVVNNICPSTNTRLQQATRWWKSQYTSRAAHGLRIGGGLLAITDGLDYYTDALNRGASFREATEDGALITGTDLAGTAFYGLGWTAGSLASPALVSVAELAETLDHNRKFPEMKYISDELILAGYDWGSGISYDPDTGLMHQRVGGRYEPYTTRSSGWFNWYSDWWHDVRYYYSWDPETKKVIRVKHDPRPAIDVEHEF